MAAKDDNARPIIIKKIKKSEEGHHGGQWKVAYADFVTAMMAFFLMLWLLNATTEEQRNGIADYFSPTSISQDTSGGGGMLSGQTIAKDGALVHKRAPIGVNVQIPPTENLDSPEERKKEGAAASDQEGEGGPDEDDKSAEDLRRELAEKEAERFAEAKQQIETAIAQSPGLQGLENNVRIEVTDEGLKIQLVDQLNRPMFESGGTEPLPRTRQLLSRVTQAISGLPNEISIKGHTDAIPFNRDDYSNWELSADRANASRRVMTEAGLAPERIDEVVGRADQDLLVPENPRSPRNRRISILLKRQQALPGGNDGGQSGTGAARATRESQPEAPAGNGGDGAAGTGPETQVGPSILEDGAN